MPDALALAVTEIQEKARTHAFDAYLASLRAPEHSRADLLTLAAFRGEISRVPVEVGDAALAEIKLQWWRDAIAQGMFGARSGNPIADALVELLSRHNLAHDVALRFIDGIARELYEDGIEDEAALAAYAAETEGAMGELALGVLGATVITDKTQSFHAECATALALTHLARSLPIHISRGRLPVPLAWRAELGDPRGAEGTLAADRAGRIANRLAAQARDALRRAKSLQTSVPPNNFAAFLSVVLVEPYLRALAKAGHDAARDVVDISPITRVVRLLIASWRHRI